ncbi:hypothetical protein Bca52824_073129 [Brassica carinata]|uniref:DUF4283 domain-containing protein n=1 Tax=Brassica carinata TaxID=52824 RepID=A0A8X7QCG1_BRACI|nr:hypothetical protein Bca52824_073129 [Brassica carinata]
MTARVPEGDLRVQCEEERDATMEDIIEKGRPPGEPPDAPGSWVRKVIGCNVGGMPVPEEVVAEEFVESRLKLEFPNGEDGEPVIKIGEEVLTAINSLWKRCMIVRVLGRNVPLLSLSRKLKELWKPKGSMFVMDLPRQFFMVRFELEEEYMAALVGGPWRAFGSYLMVQAWSPEFDPLKDEIVTTPVWVRLSNIPVNFYHKTILMGIAKGLGRPIKVDLTTLNFKRARIARICVEINLHKPLKGTVMINGEMYFVSYEGISTICSTCGMYGHLVHACPRNLMERALAPVTDPLNMNLQSTALTANETDFTPARQTRRKSEQQRSTRSSMRSNDGRAMMGSKIREVRNADVAKEVTVSNRFGSLREVEVTEVREDEEGRNEESKENENNVNIRLGDSSGTRVEVMAFGVTGNKGNQFNMRNPNVQKPKSKVIGPTRGLVFGPTRGEIDMSVNGKCLRIESQLGLAGEQRSTGKESSLTDDLDPHLDQVGEALKSMEA